MKICAVSSKQCWRGADGRWMSSGGFPLQMAAIASLFDAMTLVIVEREPGPGGTPLPDGARVVPLPTPRGRDWSRKLWLLSRVLGYARALDREMAEADVVHTPVPGDIPVLAMALALLRRRRLVVRYGSSWETTTETTAMNRLTRFLIRVAAGGRNVMFATGMGGEPPAPGVHWLFATAISSEELRSFAPGDLSRGPSDPFRLVYPGRLSREKGVDDLVEAIGLLRREGLGDRVSLTIVGEGPKRTAMEVRLRELGCDRSVRFTGLLDRAALLEELAQADLCVLPSLSESFCKARLDAMACGVPVLTTEVGFGRALVGNDGERGWVVEAGRPAAIAERVLAAMRGPVDWPALRLRCRRYVGRFTLEAWAARIASQCAAQWGSPVVAGKLTLPC